MAWRLLGIGWYIPGCLVLGAFLGHMLDEKFGTSPWFAFAGVTIGLVIALIGVYLMVLPLLQEERQEGKEKE